MAKRCFQVSLIFFEKQAFESHILLIFFSARWELKSVDFAHPAQKLFSVRSIDYSVI